MSQERTSEICQHMQSADKGQLITYRQLAQRYINSLTRQTREMKNDLKGMKVTDVRKLERQLTDTKKQLEDWKRLFKQLGDRIGTFK